MVGIRLSTVGRDVKVVSIDESRYYTEWGVKMPMTYQDELVEKVQGNIGTIVEYDKESNMYHVVFDYIDVWLHRNEFVILMSNMLW